MFSQAESKRIELFNASNVIYFSRARKNQENGKWRGRLSRYSGWYPEVVFLAVVFSNSSVTTVLF